MDNQTVDEKICKLEDKIYILEAQIASSISGLIDQIGILNSRLNDMGSSVYGMKNELSAINYFFDDYMTNDKPKLDVIKKYLEYDGIDISEFM